jgi:hypothetical protein
MNIEISRLKNSLEMEKMKKDDFYGYIQELTYIIENACPNLHKNDVFNAINEFTEIRHKELESDSIGYIEIPKINIENAKRLYGFHYELEFHFDENGKLKKISYPKYEPYYQRIN